MVANDQLVELDKGILFEIIIRVTFTNYSQVHAICDFSSTKQGEESKKDRHFVYVEILNKIMSFVAHFHIDLWTYHPEG